MKSNIVLNKVKYPINIELFDDGFFKKITIGDMRTLGEKVYIGNRYFDINHPFCNRDLLTMLGNCEKPILLIKQNGYQKSGVCKLYIDLKSIMGKESVNIELPSDDNEYILEGNEISRRTEDLLESPFKKVKSEGVVDMPAAASGAGGGGEELGFSPAKFFAK